MTFRKMKYVSWTLILASFENIFYANWERKILIETCKHFGKNVSLGSGNYANRVPDLNDIATWIDNNLDFPTGDFVCDNCDKKDFRENE